MESELSYEKQRKIRISILNRLKEISQRQQGPISLPESGQDLVIPEIEANLIDVCHLLSY